MLLSEIVAVSEAVRTTSARTEKVDLLAGLLQRMSPDEASIGISFLSGSPTQQRLGAGYATVYRVEAPPAADSTLEIVDVDAVLTQVAAVSGPGSRSLRENLLEDLLARATASEQVYLRNLMVRNLRQGALEGVMAEAAAVALGVTPARVRRAAMLEGDLVAVTARALAEGPDSLAESALSVFTPVQPMLAKAANSAGEALAGAGSAVIEQKLDGLRLQVHRRGNRVAVFTRNLRDVTDEVPGIATSATEIDAESFILDGEGLMVDEDGSPLSFQDSMSRPGDGGDHPLTVFYFDVLHRDGVDLIDEPLSARRQALSELVGPAAQVGSLVTNDPEAANQYFADSVAAGFEGVVVKTLSQPYEAGRRGTGWLKVKPTHTLDLVILAAEWGSGRRQGWLSNLHLGAIGPDGDYVMLGKTFKGLTDDMLEWQTAAFLEIEDRREGRAVFLKPSIVYEVAFDGVQRSTRYPGGVALRFARVKSIRDDKRPEDADSLETVRSFI